MAGEQINKIKNIIFLFSGKTNEVHVYFNALHPFHDIDEPIVEYYVVYIRYKDSVWTTARINTKLCKFLKHLIVLMM